MVVQLRTRSVSPGKSAETSEPTLSIFVLLAVTIASLLAIVTPSNRGPDEPMHADLVLKASEWELGNPISETLGPGVEASLARSKGVLSKALLAEEATPRAERLSYEALGGLTGETGSKNGITQHPPLYYVYNAIFREVVLLTMPDPIPWDQDMVLMRLANLPLLVITILFSAAALRRLRLPRSSSLLLILFLPQFLWLHAIVNNDNMLITTSSAFVYLLAGPDQLRRRRGVAWLGVACGLGLLTKAFAISFVIIGSAVVFLMARTLKTRVVNTLLFNAVAFLAGGWWYAWRWSEYGTPLPRQQILQNVNPVDDLNLLYFLRRFVLQMTSSFVGKFGWLDVRTAWPYSAAVLLGTLALLALGVWRSVMHHRSMNGLHLVFWVMTGFWLLQVAVGFRFALNGHLYSGLFPAMQGRYLFPTVPALVLLIGIILGGPWGASWRLIYLGLPVPWILSLKSMFDAWYQSGTDRLSLTEMFTNVAAWTAVDPAWVIVHLVLVAILMSMLIRRGLARQWTTSVSRT